MSATNPRPVIAIACDLVRVYQHPSHAAFDAYVRAVADAAGGLPLLLPALGAGLDLGALMGSVDGVLLTGSPSNVEPARYGGAADPEMLLDTERDATTLPAIVPLADAGVPLFGVCRGLQEMNVAFGGTLHAEVQAQPGHRDHSVGDLARPLVQWYEDRHVVHLQRGGRLQALLQRDELVVNSLHDQGIATLAPRLRAEARADDGLVEAVSVADSPGFSLAVQWHPEMRVHDSAEARALFVAFGQACRQRAQQRLARR